MKNDVGIKRNHINFKLKNHRKVVLSVIGAYLITLSVSPQALAIVQSSCEPLVKNTIEQAGFIMRAKDVVGEELSVSQNQKGSEVQVELMSASGCRQVENISSTGLVGVDKLVLVLAVFLVDQHDIQSFLLVYDRKDFNVLSKPLFSSENLGELYEILHQNEEHNFYVNDFMGKGYLEVIVSSSNGGRGSTILGLRLQEKQFRMILGYESTQEFPQAPIFFRTDQEIRLNDIISNIQRSPQSLKKPEQLKLER